MKKYFKIIVYDLSDLNKIFVEITKGKYKGFKIMFHDTVIIKDENNKNKNEYSYKLLDYPKDFNDTDVDAYENFLKKLYYDVSREKNGN